jgi:hypothetical protein
MSDDDSLKAMELRLERIEKAIETIARPKRGELEIAEADVEAYHRVRSALWEDGACGINETSPCVFACIIVDKICRIVPIPIPRPCDFECTCGPCNIFTDYSRVLGGLARFGHFGR